jgi:hypothetical protein
MFFKHLLFAVLISVLLTGVFVFGFRKRGPWDSFLLFFLVVGLGAWAGGIWFPALGPSVWGVHWLPFFIVGLIVSLLLVAAMPPVPPDTTVLFVEKGEEPEAKKRMVLSVYFWLMVITLMVLIVTRYF